MAGRAQENIIPGMRAWESGEATLPRRPGWVSWAGPWLSPQLVKRKRVPKLLPAITGLRTYSPSKLPSSSAICFADEVLTMPTTW